MPALKRTDLLHQGGEVRIRQGETHYRLGRNLLLQLVELYKEEVHKVNTGTKHPGELEISIEEILRMGAPKLVEDVFDREVVGYMLANGKLKPYEEPSK